MLEVVIALILLAAMIGFIAGANVARHDLGRCDTCGARLECPEEHGDMW